MIVKMTTAGTDRTTWKDVCYNISTGHYQSSSGLLFIYLPDYYLFIYFVFVVTQTDAKNVKNKEVWKNS